jgi:hypothetical protein
LALNTFGYSNYFKQLKKNNCIFLFFSVFLFKYLSRNISISLLNFFGLEHVIGQLTWYVWIYFSWTWYVWIYFSWTWYVWIHTYVYELNWSELKNQTVKWYKLRTQQTEIFGCPFVCVIKTGKVSQGVKYSQLVWFSIVSLSWCSFELDL